MTENEANMSIKHAVCVLETIGNGLTLRNENDREDACVLAIKALEKQIPKKPIIKADRYAWFCPCCDGYIRSTYTRKEIILEEDVYCGRCGQKLDWND